MNSHTFASHNFCPELKAIVDGLEEQKAKAVGVVDGARMCEILNCSPSELGNKRRRGEISSFLIGTKRVYPVAPAIDYLAAKAIASFSPEGEPLRARRPAGMFKPGHTPSKPTSKQREALRRGNALRVARARARKEAVASA
jgi:hypothetical protein